MGHKERICKGRCVQLELKQAWLFVQVWAHLNYFCYCSTLASFFTNHLTLIPLFILLNNSLCFYGNELHLSVQAGSFACVFSKFPAPLNSIASVLRDSLWAIKRSNALETVCVSSALYVDSWRSRSWDALGVQKQTPTRFPGHHRERGIWDVFPFSPCVSKLCLRTGTAGIILRPFTMF